MTPLFILRQGYGDFTNLPKNPLKHHIISLYLFYNTNILKKRLDKL